jgi:uncharacterized protein YdeI (YjbR/CyaY-like superfamily)
MNPEFDRYIDAAQEFAKPILMHLRKLIHQVCPEVEEKMKWSFPHFDYKGSMLCSMASFKEHCAFGFWKASIIDDTEGILSLSEKESMGHLGKLRSLNDLPDDAVLIKYIKEAMRLNDLGIKLPSTNKKVEKKELIVSEDFNQAISENKNAREIFDRFSYSNKKDYIEWIEDAKTETTRIKRMQQAVEWISEGKSRHWKYQK